MNNEAFLQRLRDGSLEEGRAYINEQIAELGDYDAVGNALADEALARLYSPFLSLKLAELLTFYGEQVQHLPTRALGLKARGDALVQMTLYQAALESLDESGTLFLQVGDEENWAHSRISWMTAATSLGQVEEALRAAGKAREIFAHLNQTYWVCVIDHNTAWVYMQTGRYQEVNALYERMLTIYPTLEDANDMFLERAIAMAKHGLAVNLSLLGKFEQAYLVLQEAQQSFRALSETDMVVNAEIDLASFDHGQGYFGSAIQRYYHAQDLLKQYTIHNPTMEANLKLQIANILVKLNRADEARQLASEAVTIYRGLDTSLDTMNALREYATALAPSGHFKEALAALDEAATLFSRGELTHHVLAIKLQRAEVHLLMNNFNAAFQEASALTTLFEQQGLIARAVRSNLIVVEALLGLADQQHETAQATLFLQKAATLGRSVALQARRSHLQEEVYQSQSLLGRLFALQGDSKKALRRYRAAITQIERILDDLLYDLSPSFLRTAWAVYSETIALFLQQKHYERAFHYLERARSMALRQYLNRSRAAPVELAETDAPSPELLEKNALILRTQDELNTWQELYRSQSKLLAEIDSPLVPAVDQETLRAEMKRGEARINELFERLYLQQATRLLAPRGAREREHEANLLDVARLRQHLQTGQLLLAYFLHKERLVIFAVTSESLFVHEIADGMQQIKRLLPFLHAHLQPGGWPDPQQPPQQAIRQMLRKLYQLLIAPVADYLPPVPDQLIIVPYGPLHTLPFHALYDGTRFLIEQFQISYLPTSNLLSPTTHSTTEADTRKTPLVFCYSGKGQLQHALAEANMLAQMLEARSYLEEEATIAHLSEQAPGSPIIHIATHGHSRLDAPNFSAVTLADGRFSAIDAFSLDLRNCELVTLSGCETGLALIGGGDEQLGLGRAFLAAGAQSLVISLWPVEDSATSELMQNFYQHLLQGASRVQALGEAQRQLIHSSTLAHTHPYYWAAFRLVGQTGPLCSYESYCEEG